MAVVLLLLFRKTREPIAGICSMAMEQTVQKNANKEKILSLLREKGQLSNTDIRAALGVSERSAVRYLDELEKEGKAEQVGLTGRSVIYRLKP